ncbi:MAG: translocation/assembly module TamB [Bryobacteraceae bacterium]|nr:translocation/assembly module TamB [Bryobacteraceae bacterium]
MKGKRRLFRWFAAVALVLLLSAAASILVVRSEWFQQAVRERIVREMEAVTGGRARLGSFHFDLRTMQVHMTDLVLRGREDPAEPPLFRVASLRASLRLLSLIKPSVDLRALVLDRPEIHIVFFEDGSTNLPGPQRRPRKGTVQQLLDLAVDDFRVEDGRLNLQERRMPLFVRAERFRTQWVFDPARPGYEGSFSAARMETSFDGSRSFSLACDIRLRLDARRLEIAQATFALPGSRLDVRGAIENWVAPRARFEYAGRLRFEDLRGALGGAGLPVRGDARIEGRAELGTGESWTAGRIETAGLLIEGSGLWVAGVGAKADFSLRPGRFEWRNLHATLLGGRITGRGALTRGRYLNFEGSFEHLVLRELAMAAGYVSDPYQALLSGRLELRGDTQLPPERWGIRAAVELGATPEGEPLAGRFEASYDGRAGTLVVGPSYLATRASRIELSGTAGQRLDVNLHTTNWEDLERLRSLLPSLRSQQIPWKMALSTATFRGAVHGSLAQPRISGRLWVEGLRVQGQALDALETEVEASPEGLSLRGLRLATPDLVATGALSLGLEHWRASRTSPFSATLSFQSADVARALARCGQSLPLAGRAEATLMISGTLASPQAKARWVLARGAALGQEVERLAGEASYRDGVLTIRRLEAALGSGRLVLRGSYTHSQDSLAEGRLRFEASAQRLQVAALRFVGLAASGWRASASAKVQGTVRIAGGLFDWEALDGRLELDNVAWRGMDLGAVVLNASTERSAVALELRGELGGAGIEGRGTFQLARGYPGQASLRFGRLRVTEWLDRLNAKGERQPSRPPVEIFAAGKLDFHVASLGNRLWKALLELDAIELRPRVAGKISAFSLVSPEPWIVELGPGEARIGRARLAGRKTELELTGSFRFPSRYPLNLRFRGAFDVEALQDLDPDLRTGGQVLLDATLRGTLERPDLYGRVELRDAFINYRDLPNGLDKINGIVFLYRDRATIERLTGESGGGKVSLQGFVALGEAPGYWVQLRASDVRVRYPEGLSSTMNAVLALSGNGTQGVLTGELTLTRAAFHPQTDLGSMLVRSAQRPERPSHPLFENVRLDVRIRTAPQVRLETSLTRSLQAEADLRLRGTLLRPALLGRALISQGEILFFGNRYSIDSGEILFVNPSRIEPVVNLHLQTRVRGVEVTLNINGPLNKTTVTYRSDPPLPFSDVVALLATGRAPSTAPGLSAARSEFAQSWEQAGASALVSQAITSPLAGRLQRFLGVSRLKIDPTVRGIENTPEAHLTLEQQITPDVTLVYITNLARAQQQTIRLEWDFTRNFSALAVREANGLFGVDFLYKRRFK